MALIALRDYVADRTGQPGAVASGPGVLPPPRRTLVPDAPDSESLQLTSLARLAAATRGVGTAAGVAGAPNIGSVLGAAGSGASLVRNLLDRNLSAPRRSLGAAGDAVSLLGNAARFDTVRSLVPGLTTAAQPIPALSIPATGGAGGAEVSGLGAAGAAVGVGLGAHRLASGGKHAGAGGADIAFSLMSLANPVFGAMNAVAQIAHGFASNSQRKNLTNSIKRTKEAQEDFREITSSLSGVRSEEDFRTALDTPVSNVKAKLGTVLHTIARQNLAGDYAAVGWDPDPSLRAAVGLFERMGIPVQDPTPKNQAGGPPPNPWEPSTPAFWELYQLTATPLSVQGVELNNATGSERWGPILSALSTAAVTVDPTLAQAGPEPISREALNRRLTEGQFSFHSMDRGAQVDEREGRPAEWDPESPAAIAERLGNHLEATYYRGGDPDHIRQRFLEHYQALTGQPWRFSGRPDTPGMGADAGTSGSPGKGGGVGDGTGTGGGDGGGGGDG